MLLHRSGLFGDHGSQRSEKAVRFMVGAGRKEKRRGWTGTGVVAEGERPKSIDGQNRVVRILHKADKFLGESVVSSDPPAAEISHEDAVAEDTEIAGRPNDSPRRIQRGTVLKMADVVTIGLVKFHETIALTGHVVMLRGVLLGVGNKERSADILNVEGREVARKGVIVEQFFGDVHALEGVVVNFHSSRTEIRDVKEGLSVYDTRGGTFINRALR